VKKSGAAYVKNVFPLIEKQIARQDCMDIILLSDFDFSMPVRSGCFFCPFNSLSRWTEIYEKHKDLFSKARELEENSKHYPKQRLMKWTLGALQEKLEKNEQLPEVYVKRLCSSECII
jgi:hypothetical protein